MKIRTVKVFYMCSEGLCIFRFPAQFPKRRLFESGNVGVAVNFYNCIVSRLEIISRPVVAARDFNLKA